MTKKILFAIMLLLCACSGDPVRTEATNNRNFNVGLLFEHDGCKVYRFSDGGHWRYYAVCAGRQSTTMGGHYNAAGKAWHYVAVEIPTVWKSHD